MTLQVWFYAELETFVLTCKFNSKSLAPSFENFWLRHCMHEELLKCFNEGIPRGSVTSIRLLQDKGPVVKFIKNSRAHNNANTSRQ